MFTIVDNKAKCFHPPYFAQTRAEADRIFTTIVNTEQNQISQFPEDFDLYYIGEYDDGTGKMYPLTTPEHCIKAMQVRRDKSPDKITVKE